jgi:hypothetical protein
MKVQKFWPIADDDMQDEEIISTTAWRIPGRRQRVKKPAKNAVACDRSNR